MVGRRSAVTIAAIFGFISQAITGYGPPNAVRIFSLGVNEDLFAFETADFLSGAKLDGRVLNLALDHGDALIWKTPNRKSFIDSRKHLFRGEVEMEVNTLRKALAQNATEIWKKILNERGVSVLMVSPRTAVDQPVYLGLKKASDAWILFHDDGNAALFGRVDADAADLKYFKEHRLDADDIVYRRQEPIRLTFEPPSEVSWIDDYYRLRALTPTQPHVAVAIRWLKLDEPEESASQSPRRLPTPAECFMAIRECRAALSIKSSDPMAFRVLSLAYKYLALQETALLERSGVEVTLPLQIMRMRQRITALNFAIMTTPSPDSADDRLNLAKLHGELAILYRSRGFTDLEKEQLENVQKWIRPTPLSDEEESRLRTLSEGVSQFDIYMRNMGQDRQLPLDNRYAMAPAREWSSGRWTSWRTRERRAFLLRR